MEDIVKMSVQGDISIEVLDSSGTVVNSYKSTNSVTSYFKNLIVSLILKSKQGLFGTGSVDYSYWDIVFGELDTGRTAINAVDNLTKLVPIKTDFKLVAGRRYLFESGVGTINPVYDTVNGVTSNMSNKISMEFIVDIPSEYINVSKPTVSLNFLGLRCSDDKNYPIVTNYKTPNLVVSTASKIKITWLLTFNVD